MCIGSLHGNEPSGTEALHRVDWLLDETGCQLVCGEILFLVGNLQALAQKRRFLDRDLNRGWSREAISRAREHGPRDREDHEMLALEEYLEQCQAGARGPLLFLDLHTTSAHSPPFASVVDIGPAQHLSAALPVPTVLGMDSHLEGTLLEELHSHDFCGIIFEGGQHDAASSVDHNEAATWLLLDRLGFLPSQPPPPIAARLEWSHLTLHSAAGHLPGLMQIEYRHAIDETSQFRMRPGFRSFEEVEKGQLLAQDRNGEIRSRHDGRLLMPLYQAQGDDGFFIVRDL